MPVPDFRTMAGEFDQIMTARWVHFAALDLKPTGISGFWINDTDNNCIPTTDSQLWRNLKVRFPFSMYLL